MNNVKDDAHSTWSSIQYNAIMHEFSTPSLSEGLFLDLACLLFQDNNLMEFMVLVQPALQGLTIITHVLAETTNVHRLISNDPFRACLFDKIHESNACEMDASGFKFTEPRVSKETRL